LATGLSSLIGPEAVIYFDRERHEVVGANNIRGGCHPGENHSGTQAHKFLSHLFKVAKTGQTIRLEHK
jgi:hypothetical protein